VSANTRREIEAARNAGADYVGVGPIYPTATKPDARPPIGVAGLRVVARGIPELPIVAIGGITRSNGAGILEGGADYVAVISAICHEPDPVQALDAFLSALADGVG
jgi:thiamine-phosphate pyrophosphorylase